MFTPPIIGENAGKVWHALQQKGSLNITALKKNTKLDDKSLHLALGWLAREGKVQFEQKQRQLLVELIQM
jgi:hypothetical protein